MNFFGLLINLDWKLMEAQIKTRKSEKRTRLSEVIPLTTPYVVFIDPSSACNFKCTFCPTGDLGLMKSIGRYQGTLKLNEFEKLINDFEDFNDPIKVLRLYKDGEPFVNKHFEKMVSIARRSSKVDKIDTTTNAALINHSRAEKVIEAGIDLINISIDGLDAQQLYKFTKAKLDYSEFVNNIKYLYEIKGNCEIVIKTTREIIGADREQEFYDTFGNYCNRIFVENTAPCWPDFDVEERMGITIKEGLYGNDIVETIACPYLFYSVSVNSDMKVSACFVDWSRDLTIGDARISSLMEIWGGPEMSAHRLEHLSGNRSRHPICGACGQLSHCGPDSIDADLLKIKKAFDDQGFFNNLSTHVLNTYKKNKIIKLKNI